ncbi:MAG: type II toxin-antitoxin system VapC family toxin [Candidatus Marsarchaeota archaeon]|nr:type II toxin-antitoxin system VapC family toxin [Candidatus Marsarchaeota archaeon]
MVVLDTNLVIDIFNGHEPTRKALARFSEETLGITIFTEYEILRGATEANESRTRSFLGTFRLYYFTEPAMEETIGLYKKPGSKRVGELDLMILGICHAHSEVLATRDKAMGAFDRGVTVIRA